MAKITIRPAWTFISETGETVDPQLFRLLGSIHDTGKLTLAAKQAKISYRYAWDLLGKWSQFFGSPLVHMQRGKGATLTPLGARLLWAEQRSDARLFQQLENIASDLNLEINRGLKNSQSIIRLHASHGYAVEKLPPLMRRYGHAEVDLQYMSSVAALTSLSQSQCELAGFHVPIGELSNLLWAPYAKWLRSRQLQIVRLVIRTQGLILAKGNPLNISSLSDLTRPGIRFVNRQRSSGTRTLLDGMLRSLDIDPRRIPGYEGGEFTHAAVAAFVASGMADVGFGVEPAARQFKLDFVPMVKERYMLGCRNKTLRQPGLQELIAMLRGPEFQEVISHVPGYEPDQPGELITVKDVFA
ncbi:MAG: helix-turn-helix transcriptional regulator [Gammaproteobacteria bacterium]|nr:helix-turn-helix transcriptional regulator [Gammaproteobacteria bacterium]